MFTTSQPKDGECILHCAHATTSKLGHWFKISEIEFQRPDGTVGKSKWLLLCEECYRENPEANPEKLEIAGDSIWIGDEPAIIHNPVRPDCSTAVENN
jgi:hypothetical protein